MFPHGFRAAGCTCLDLGSGPGHLAMAVAQASAMKVDALDRSVEVQEIVGKNLRNAGLEGKVIPLAGDVAKIPMPRSISWSAAVRSTSGTNCLMNRDLD